MSKEFIHLHNHSEYSILDGLLRISKNGRPTRFLRGLAEGGVKAMALTDCGNMYGALDFYDSARSVGLKPIVGCEMYITDSKITDKGKTSRTGHITLLAKNYKGYLNLMRLNSYAWADGFYYHPRIDKELLARYSDGLIALSGCLKGFLAQAALTNSFEKACAAAKEFEDIMGKGNYYIELMDHGIRAEQTALPFLKEIAKKLNIKTVAANDCRYEKKEDWEVYDIIRCIAQGKTLNDPQFSKMTSREFYFKSPEEMYELFSHTPEALINTLEIAEKCNLEFPKQGFVLPKFDVPPQYHNTAEYLKTLCREGLKRKMGGNVPPEYLKRLEYELDIIIKTGIEQYFVIMQDLISWARGSGIPIGAGRGSITGSIAAYSLDITRVDPIKNKLLFERFINPDCASVPAWEIDVSDTGRERVINYMRKKYGKDKVSRISMFGNIKAKQAVRYVARALGISAAETNRVAEMISNTFSNTLDGALENSKELQNELASNTSSQHLFDLARKIEGLKLNHGVYAAGVLLTEESVSQYVPLCRTSEGEIVSQFESARCTDLGLMKIDLLGFRLLTAIDEAEILIRKQHNPNFAFANIPLDDKKTYDMICAGQTNGLFQLDSAGMRDLIKKLQPAKLDDIAALMTLYRPGPMESGITESFLLRKNGQEKFSYETPLLEEVLKDTYGCIIYQEQIMQIAQTLGGFTPGEAENLRKALGKKKSDDTFKFGKKFVEGAKARNISEKAALHIYEQMKTLSVYTFNKAHAYSYALISYQTAYLKAHYPAEFEEVQKAVLN